VQKTQHKVVRSASVLTSENIFTAVLFGTLLLQLA